MLQSYSHTKLSMKFRARLRKESVVTINSVTSTMQKIGATAAIFLNEECIRIAVITECADSCRCYSQLDPKILFPDDYRIESQSSNTILFEIGLDHLSRALTSGRNATQSQFKLVKRGVTPCLCYEAKDSDSLAVSVASCCCKFPLISGHYTRTYRVDPPRIYSMLTGGYNS